MMRAALLCVLVAGCSIRTSGDERMADVMAAAILWRLTQAQPAAAAAPVEPVLTKPGRGGYWVFVPAR
jgi:hypothetical protein